MKKTRLRQIKILGQEKTKASSFLARCEVKSEWAQKIAIDLQRDKPLHKLALQAVGLKPIRILFCQEIHS